MIQLNSKNNLVTNSIMSVNWAGYISLKEIEVIEEISVTDTPNDDVYICKEITKEYKEDQGKQETILLEGIFENTIKIPLINEGDGVFVNIGKAYYVTPLQKDGHTSSDKFFIYRYKKS